MKKMNKQSCNLDKLYVGVTTGRLPLPYTLKFWECDHLGRYSSQTKQTINTNCRVGIAHHSGNLKATTLTDIKKVPSEQDARTTVLSVGWVDEGNPTPSQ